MGRVKASVTIFMSIVILSVTVLICTFIETARVNVAQTKSKAYAYMTTDSVFAGYGRELYEDYGILLVWERQSLDEQIVEYMQANIDKADLEGDYYDFTKSEVENVIINEQKYATQDEGEIFAKQVVSFAKYAALAEAAEELLDQFNNYESGSEDTENKKENSNVTNITNEISEELLELVEEINESFKELQNTKKLKGKFSAVKQKYNLLKEDIIQGSHNEDSHNKKVRKFIAKYKKLLKRVNVEKNNIDKTIKIIDKYQEYMNEADLSEENYSDYILKNKKKLENAQLLINELTDIHIENYSDINADNMKNIEKAIKKVSDIENELWELKLNQVSEENEKDKTLYEKAKEVISSGALSLIVEDVNDISNAAIDFTDLPSSLEEKGINSTIEKIKNKAVFTKYISLYFGNYIKEPQYGNEDTALKYEMEYIISGKTSDKENLEATLEKMLVLRNTVNAVYIIRDSAKMAELESIAISAATAIGVPFASTVIKAVLIEAWALTEAIIDVRALVRGEKIQLLKTSENWKSSLENLGNYDLDKGDETGLEYKEYAELLLVCTDSHKVIYRTMDLIQVNMQKRYNSNFKMSECFAECDVTVNMAIEPIFTALPFVTAVLNEENEVYEYSIKIKYGY